MYICLCMHTRLSKCFAACASLTVKNCSIFFSFVKVNTSRAIYISTLQKLWCSVPTGYLWLGYPLAGKDLPNRKLCPK